MERLYSYVIPNHSYFDFINKKSVPLIDGDAQIKKSG